MTGYQIATALAVGRGRVSVRVCEHNAGNVTCGGVLNLTPIVFQSTQRLPVIDLDLSNLSRHADLI